MPDEDKAYSVKEYILFRLDRTISIIGLVVLGGWGVYLGTPESLQMSSAIAGGLIVYVTGRSNNG